jgi:DNA-binding LacI/PurR family transcriptional regulator
MITAQTLPWLKKLPIPVVVINCIEVLPYSFHQVCFHYEPGFEKAVAYLNKRGVKNIFLAGVNTETTNARAEVLKKVATASKISVQTLEFENPQQADIGTSMTVLAGRKHGKYFLDNKLDGVIFTLSDFIALGIIDIAKERNLELGKDIRIISYDNLESRLPCTENQKLITSINHPLEELAAESVQLCNEVISNTTASGVTKIRRVPSKDLIIRKSFY